MKPSIGNNVENRSCSSSSSRSNFFQLSSDFSEILGQINSQNHIKPTLLMKSDIIFVRDKITDWLLVVCRKLTMSDYSYFLVIELMDSFLETCPNETKIDENFIHLISVACLIIVSKYVEVRFVGMDLAVREILRNKFTKEQVRSAEMLILRRLKFKIKMIYFEEFAREIILQVIGRSSVSEASKSDRNEKAELLLNASRFVLKLVLQNYSFFIEVKIK